MRVTFNAELPPPLRRLRHETERPDGGAAAALKIAYPPDGARIDLGLTDGARARLSLKALGGARR